MARERAAVAELTPADPDETLSWEASHRRSAAIAAALAGVTTLAGGIVGLTASGDLPNIGVIQGLTPALRGQQDAAVNPRTAIAQFLADHTFVLTLSGVLAGIAGLAAGYALLFLLRATVARRPQVPAFARWVVMIGSVLYGITSVLLPLVRCLRAQDYINGTDRSRDAINLAFGGAILDVLAALSLAGVLAFALSFVLVCINARRTGLLTRFMGILGLLVGALYVFQFANLPVVQSFWLLALVPVFLLQWPGGSPPAWTSGKAEPWPTQAQLREQRLEGQTRKKGDDEPDPVFDDVVDRGAEPAPAPRSTTARKRRKRR
jgi:hypothetical protein